MKLDWLHLTLLVLLAVLGVAFWFDLYRYERVGSNVLVRIHRVTGSADRLTAAGWKPMESLPERAAKPDIFDKVTSEGGPRGRYVLEPER
jgi:hypothetical protein